MFCQLFSLQNKSFLCLQHVENKGFQTVIKHRLKAIQKPIKNELGNREKNTKNAHFVLKKCTFRFRDYINNLNSKQLYTIKLKHPSDQAEQRAIASILSDMDAEIAELEAKRDKYKEVRQGMMQQLLTGKIRLI